MCYITESAIENEARKDAQDNTPCDICQGVYEDAKEVFYALPTDLDDDEPRLMNACSYCIEKRKDFIFI